MIFGPVPVAEAEGAILAHSVTSASGRIAKGTVLTKTHVAALAQAGHAEVTVARLDAGDIEENQAAEQLARAIVPDPSAQHVRISAAGAGRVNLYATCPGVTAIASDKISAINAIDPMITVATVPHLHRVDAGMMIATIKIISYGVPGLALGDACTVSPHALGILPHDSAAIACAIDQAPGDILFILTASATSDPRDVAPEALRSAGGRVEAYGMPVDPGNLLFFGDVDGKPVIGLPGCARSPALNGADWVLERLICGVALTQADISALGIGGLLKEIPTRPRPRASGSGPDSA